MHTLNQTMLKNYIKIAWRNLVKSSVYSTVNILGLAIATGCCILVFLFIRYETSFDAFHKHAENIHLIVQEQALVGNSRKAVGLTPLPYGPVLEVELPGIQSHTRIAKRTGFVEKGANKFSEQITFADSTFLKVFDFPLKQGLVGELLTEPDHVLVTSSVAEKYFGKIDPLGETISIHLTGSAREYVIKGVIENVPANSTVSFDIVLPIINLPGFKTHEDDFTTSLIHTYIKVTPSTRESDIEANLQGFSTRHWPDNELEPAPIAMSVPLTELHFLKDIEFGPGTPGNSALLYVMGGIALIVLLIACVNFILLAVGRLAERGKEVGIRKVLGAERKQLMAQYFGEALIQITLAVAFGMIIAEFALPMFNRLADTQVSWDLIGIVPLAVFIISLIVTLGLFTGLYPGILHSRLVPIKALKSEAKTTGLNTLGRILMIFQFSLSICLIIGTMAMYSQLDYLKSKPLGYDGDQVVMIPAQNADAGQYLSIIRDQAQSKPGIVSVSGTSSSFTQGGAWGTKEITIDGKSINALDYKVDNKYIETLGIDLLAGRNFSNAFPSDPSKAIIVNQAFIEELELENPIGKTVAFRGQREIVGIAENFHFQSLHEKVSPLVLHTSEGWPLMHIAVRVQPGQIAESIGILETTWKELMPGETFEFHFLDEQMDRLYRQEERWTEIITYVALLAILIACIGLVGLTSIITENRKKEIGIRKLLGATIPQLLMLITGNFVLIFGIAFFIATPVSYLLVSNWLNDYAYHIEFSWWIVALSLILTLFLALVVLSYQAIKAALMNPVDSLRSE